jgi:hypothetical protein
VEKGREIAGLGDDVSAVCIPVRDARGARPLADIDLDVSRAVRKAVAAGSAIALHIMHHSKLGTRAPSEDCIDALRAKHGAAIQVIVDACQFRLSRRRLRHYLDQGYLVLVTGSKFFNGPALSGALIVPEQFRARVSAQQRVVPTGLADYTTYFDWPASLHVIRKQLPRRENIGALLRWVAAIAEMRAYFAIPGLYRRIALSEFAAGVARASERHPEIELLPEPAWLADETDIDDEFSAQTIFPFVVSSGGKLQSLAECRAIFRALNADVRGLLGCKAMSQADIATALCHIGQPVPIPIARGGNAGALRVSADARLMSDCFSGGDITSAVSVLQQKLAQVDKIFQKTALLANNLERILPVYGEEA